MKADSLFSGKPEWLCLRIVSRKLNQFPIPFVENNSRFACRSKTRPVTNSRRSQRWVCESERREACQLPQWQIKFMAWVLAEKFLGPSLVMSWLGWIYGWKGWKSVTNWGEKAADVTNKFPQICIFQGNWMAERFTRLIILHRSLMPWMKNSFKPQQCKLIDFVTNNVVTWSDFQ